MHSKIAIEQISYLHPSRRITQSAALTVQGTNPLHLDFLGGRIAMPQFLGSKVEMHHFAGALPQVATWRGKMCGTPVAAATCGDAGSGGGSQGAGL